MKITAIKTDVGFLICDNPKRESWNGTCLNKYVYDGKEPEPTFDRYWMLIEMEPTKVERVIPEELKCTGYVLKKEFPDTETTPKEVGPDFFSEENDNYGVRGLYEGREEITPEHYEEVPFEVEILAQVDNIDTLKGLKYVVPNEAWSATTRTVEIKKAKHELIDKIFFPEILLPTRTCKLTSLQSYQIIRQHVQDNIDPKYAKITSDYDFCLTVEKKISLVEKESFKYDDNLFSKRKRKPKIKTGYRSDRKIEVYETAPLKDGKIYDGYTGTPPFAANNYRDLENKIDKFLSELMEEINKPLEDCPNCKGMGVVIEANKTNR